MKDQELTDEQQLLLSKIRDRHESIVIGCSLEDYKSGKLNRDKMILKMLDDKELSQEEFDFLTDRFSDCPSGFDTAEHSYAVTGSVIDMPDEWRLSTFKEMEESKLKNN